MANSQKGITPILTRICVVVGVKVVWISAGVSSFIAGYIVRDTVDKWIYIDVADQHPDSIRFIQDCEKLIGKEIEFLKSEKYKDVADVIRKTRMINSPYGAACTGMLKKAVRKKWENEHLGEPLTYVWGMDAKEKNRADRIVENFSEFEHEFPLIDRNLSKEDCHALALRLGLKRPIMYDMGYQNNNCVGCIKGGMWYWNQIRKDFPDVFQQRAELEREVGHSCLNGIYLDELEPNRGRKTDEINQDCGVMCYLAEHEI